MINEHNRRYEIDAITLKKMHAKLLDILVYFKDFCQEHDLMFYLLGGSAIGALREHGFIPWDDDIDCAMPRADYEKFPILWEKYGDHKRFVFCRTNEKVNYHHSGSSLRDPNTTFICSYNRNSDICHGIALELIPIDGCPSSKIKRCAQLFYAFNYALFNNQRIPTKKGIIIKFITSVIYSIMRSQTIKYRIWKYCEKQMSKYPWDQCEYVTELIGSIKGVLLEHPKEWFSSQVWVEFEGYSMPVMAGYHEYLTRIFGDYMQRPPIEKRFPQHEVCLDFVDMDHPYTDYRGIKYFPDGQSK